MAGRRSAQEDLAWIRSDPVGFCRRVLGFDPWSKQAELLEAVRDHPRVAVKSCHGSGKTAVAARAVLWFLAAFPRSTVISTAPTFNQVRQLLWREVARGVAGSSGFFANAELLDTRLELAADWFAVGLSTDSSDRFQGFHAEDLLVVVDEAAGVDEVIFEAIESVLTTSNARLLLIGNPTRTSGTFYAAFHRDRALYERITISALETPAFTGEPVPERVLRSLVSREWVETAKRRFGEGSLVWQSRVLGEFPAQADDSVVAVSEVEAAQARELEGSWPAVVAVDVARFGSDETVIASREGRVVRLERTVVKRDTMQVAGEVIRVAAAVKQRSNLAPVLVVDDVGVGGGVTDRLRELGWQVRAFNGGRRARVEQDYPNRRSELWFEFADRLGDVDLDADEQLAADLLAPRYSLDSRGRRVVEGKDVTRRRLGRSPDRADAVLLTFEVRDAGAGVSRAGVEGVGAGSPFEGVPAEWWEIRRAKRARAGLDDGGDEGDGFSYDGSL